ncbi:MAG: alpha-amylase family glycosyl hydrolase [Desulfuromonadaceae bacterium]|nr:alpha-amylase family glycosyl hydrolase [Desulfuromonadaceae bacterium]MDD5105987.1 alpha-amylase family glycosyl hydrolase [Desulfuromonadaceae bacterium]
MTASSGTGSYFIYDIQISSRHWQNLNLGALSRTIKERGIPRIQFFRQLAFKLNSGREIGSPVVHAGELNLYATLQNALRYLIDDVARAAASSLLIKAARNAGLDPGGTKLFTTARFFVELFPPAPVLEGDITPDRWLAEGLHDQRCVHQLLREMLLLRLAAVNPAIESFRELVDDSALAETTQYNQLSQAFERTLKEGPILANKGYSLFDALMAAIIVSPHSLAGQVNYLRDQWQDVFPPELLHDVDIAFDILREEQLERGGGGDPGPAPVLEFHHTGADTLHAPSGTGGVFHGFDYPEYEQFSPDANWMSHVVMIAKMVYVWLDQLSRLHGYPITRLDQIPDRELDRLATRGFTGLWLIGLWERSPASQRIKQLCGNPDAIASAYSLYDYEVAADLGGWDALANLRERAERRGIRLASDMVPNHTGIYSRWVIQHPDWFVQTDYPPFPTYQFTGEDLSHDPNVCLQVEDGYWNKSDAAVVFKHYDRNSGRTRYMYHGNDGTSIPWNDTAQLNYLIPELRESVIQTIIHVARNFPIIRFDAAMTLAKKHFQRLWFPLRGLGGGVPSRAEYGMSKEEFDAVFPVEFWREVVDRVAIEAPDTLLLAEAFWMMEGYFVRTLGMHRVYNSAFMNMLKTEENAKYRTTIKNVLEFNHEILKRFVNFMNNPDEKTAVAQFGSQGKYFGACVLLSTMPGLPMFGHGQIEGFHEKYGMEYKRAYWDEKIDEGLVRGHEMWIFPLLCRRWLFSGSENFVLYDFNAGDSIDENVFAYSNRSGEHRALVLYHNSHATTAGWIRESVSYLAPGGAETEQLVRTNLAEALGVANKERGYVAFRDHTEGLEYIRSSRELYDQGLYVELKEYQFHVFMDFRELHDDAEGAWLLLHRHLSGTGVSSLDEERKQLRYEELNAAFRIVFELLTENREVGFSVASAMELQQAVELFLTCVDVDGLIVQPSGKLRSAAGKGKRKSHRKKSQALELYTGFTELFSCKSTMMAARSFQLRLAAGFSDRAPQSLLFAWLILRETELNPISLGLDYTLRKFLRRDGEPGFESRAIELLVALLEWWRTTDRKSAASCLKQTQELFGLEACRKFLQHHESAGVEWFNKERFEELCEWQALLLLVEHCKGAVSSRFVSTKMNEAERAICQGVNLAQDVGYRSRLFVELTEKTETPRTRGAKKTVV